jgi:hypothetical protein
MLHGLLRPFDRILRTPTPLLEALLGHEVVQDLGLGGWNRLHSTERAPVAHHIATLAAVEGELDARLAAVLHREAHARIPCAAGVQLHAAALQRLALPKLLDWQLHRLLVRVGVERLGVNFKVHL